jgi:hypothetical protein
MADRYNTRKMYLGIEIIADPVCRAMHGLSLRPLDCWDRGFEFRCGHEYLSLVFVVYCVGSDLCYELITCSEESYRVCV